MRLRFGAPALLAAALLAGCSTSTGGNGTVASRPPSQSSQAGSPSGPGASPSPTGAQLDDPATARRILADATHDVEVTNTYDYRDLEQARRNALAVATGTFRAELGRTFTTLIAKYAPRLHARQTATLDEAALGPATADRATVLLFGQLALTSTSSPSGRTDPFAAVVDVQLVGGTWLLTRVVTEGTIQGDPPGTPDLARACAAARRGVADILTFARRTFEADYRRAVAETTGALRSDLVGKEAVTRSTITKGKFDLTATVRAVGVESAAGDTAVLLVAVDGFRVVAGGKREGPVQQHLKVTVQSVGGEWLLSDLESVGVH